MWVCLYRNFFCIVDLIPQNMTRCLVYKCEQIDTYVTHALIRCQSHKSYRGGQIVMKRAWKCEKNFVSLGWLWVGELILE